MKTYPLYALPILVFLCACGNDHIPELDKLEQEYAHTIKLPVDSVNALVYRFTWKCGNARHELGPLYFQPLIYSDPYKSALQKKYPVIAIQLETDSLINAGRDKYIVLDFDGAHVEDDSVMINENYEYKNEKFAITKSCVYRDGKWDVRVVH